MSAAVTMPMLAAISRTLLWQGPRGLWGQWLATLPDDLAAELRRMEAEPAPGAKEQAMKAAAQ